MKYWVSWYHHKGMGDFELHSPWWISGERMSDDAKSICAAVEAQHEAGAKCAVFHAYDKEVTEIEWRFCNERADDWSPYCERFPKADWMVWP